MKNMLSSLKGMNYKEFALDHGEKIGLGAVGLVVLLCLLGTSWGGYEKDPQELIKQAEEARQRIDSGSWPDDKRQEYPVVPFAERAQQVLKPVELARYEYETPIWHPLYRKKELIKEPEFLPVQDLIATGDDAIIAVMKNPISADEELDPDQLAGVDPDDPEAQAEVDALKEFRSNDKFAPRTGTGTSPLAGGEGFALNSDDIAAGQALNYMDSSQQMAARFQNEEMDPEAMYEEMYGGMGGGMMLGSNVDPRGMRFAAIRGWFDLQQQKEKFRRALNLQLPSEAAAFIDLIDFELERQQAVAGPDPWAEEWEPVTVETAKELLREVSDYDVEIVDPTITDSVFTMPLPYRLMGYWGDLATHPKVKNFKLSPEEAEREKRLQQLLVEQYEQLEKREQPVQKRGFDGLVRDTNSMRSELMSSENFGEIMDEMYQDMSTMYQDSENPYQMYGIQQPADLRAKLTASGRVLLFRFFDFNVEPGQVYRYRVRLSMRNPNYGRPLEQVVDASVAQGQERFTPWSNATDPVMIPRAADYFLEKVNRDPAREADQLAAAEPQAVRKRHAAEMSIYQYDPTVGTMVADTLPIRSFGQFIGGKKRTPRLNVAIPEFKDEEVTFETDTVLLDAIDDPQVPPSMHADLGLTEDSKGYVGILEQAVTLSPSGELKTIDPVANRTREKLAKARVEAERAEYQDILNKEPRMMAGEFGEGTDLDALLYDQYENSGDLMYGEGGAEMSRRRSSRGRSRNPNRLYGN